MRPPSRGQPAHPRETQAILERARRALDEAQQLRAETRAIAAESARKRAYLAGLRLNPEDPPDAPRFEPPGVPARVGEGDVPA
jgi:hypothetical protein